MLERSGSHSDPARSASEDAAGNGAPPSGDAASPPEAIEQVGSEVVKRLDAAIASLSALLHKK